jgi:hypothetical protein
VRIRGLVIQHYAPPAQMGAVRAGGHGFDGDVDRTSGWVVEDCEVRYNATGGIRVGHRMRVLRNHVHHNGQIGVNGSATACSSRGTRSRTTTTRTRSTRVGGGGTKFVDTRWLVARGNFVHHNNGPGLWTDADNVYTVYEHNRVEDNAAAGIFHEISYDAVIRFNTVRRNGFATGAWVYGAASCSRRRATSRCTATP